LEDAVREQSADASAVYLSGDIESIAVAAIAAKIAGRPLSALCFDASTDMPSVAAATKMGSWVESFAFGVHDMDKLPEAIWAMDEPVADISLVPFYLASRVAEKSSAAMLTGAGAADIFVSQPAQKQVLRAREKPRSYYGLLKSLYAYAPQASLGRSLGFEGHIGPRTKQRLYDFVAALREGSSWHQYISIAAVLDGRDKQGLYATAMTPVMETFSDLQKDPEGWPGIQGQLLAIQARSLSDGLISPLEKVSMFNSLGCRMPFADSRLAEFLISLPDHLRVKGRRDKILLRDYMAKNHPGLLPAPVPGAPVVPRKSFLAECLAAEPLKGMVETLLSEASVRRRELFDWRTVKVLLAGAKTDEEIYAKQVFALLSLELWFRIFIDHEKGWMS
jgi:asparagine synthase (glutamine-hydrolysing)